MCMCMYDGPPLIWPSSPLPPNWAAKLQKLGTTVIGDDRYLELHLEVKWQPMQLAVVTHQHANKLLLLLAPLYFQPVVASR